MPTYDKIAGMSCHSRSERGLRFPAISIVAAICLCSAASGTYAFVGGSSLSRQEKLAKHAALYSRYDEGKPAAERRAGPDGSVDLSVESLQHYGQAPEGQRISPRAQLQRLVSDCQILLVGVARQQTSAFTPHQSFIYSDWEIEVSRIIKNVSPIGVRAGSSITVTRPGGTLFWAGLKVIAHDIAFPDFTVQHTYLLCLEALPESDSFRSHASGSFDISGPSVIYLEDPHSPTDIREFVKNMSPSDFVSEISSMEEK